MRLSKYRPSPPMVVAIAALTGAALLVGLALCVPAGEAATKLPKTVKPIDRQLTKAAKTLGKRETARLRGPVRSAGRALRRGRRCAAARALTQVVVRSQKLTGKRAAAAAPVAARAQALAVKLVRSQRKKGACGLKIKVRVKRSLKPQVASLPGLPGLPSRPTFSVRGGGASGDFAQGEILFSTTGKKGLSSILRRTRGKLVSSAAGPRKIVHLIKLPGGVKAQTSASKRAELVDDLRKIDPLSRGALHASSAAGLGTIAAAADERARGGSVSLNAVMPPAEGPADLAFPGQRFLDTAAIESPIAGKYDFLNKNRNALTWTFFNASGKNAYGVGQAWQKLELAGKLGNRVRLAVIDGGFVSMRDLPSTATRTASTPGSGNSKTHGYDVAQAAAATADNGSGVIGPGAPVTDLRLIDHNYDSFGTIARIGDSVRAGARIINMSYGGNFPALVSWAEIPISKATADARRAGALPIAAAGNDGIDVDKETCALVCWEHKVVQPCESAGVLCVGGVLDNRTNRAPKSNYGRDSCGNDDCDVRVFAPYTVPLLDVDDTGSPILFVENGKTLGQAVRLGSGTSFSAPYVAGVAALVRAADPGLNTDAVERILLGSANESADDSVPRVVNADAAVSRALGKRPPVVGIASPRPGSLTYTGSPHILEGLAVAGDTVPCCSYRWTSSRQGFLGSGPRISKTLDLAFHTITLEATDLSGRKATKSIPVDLVPKFIEPSTLTATCPTGVAPGDFPRLTGRLTPAVARTVVRVEVEGPDGYFQQTLADTNANGDFGVGLPSPTLAGAYRVTATFNGDGSRRASSVTCGFFAQEPGPGKLGTVTTLDCPERVTQNQTSTWTGSVSPPPGSFIFLEFTGPSGQKIFRGPFPIDGSGHFRDSFVWTGEQGTWRVFAEFSESPTHLGSTSNICTFTSFGAPK